MSVHPSTSDPSSSPAIENFQHEPLPDPATHIRLLEITSVDEIRDLPVHCKLTTWPVETAPLYTAISYTWGDPRQLTSVLVNGRPMEVRCNCEYVLKQAWWRKGNVYVWVDAICINQADNDEKSSQVAMMGAVYENAGQVLACVGQHADDSGFLLQMLHKKQLWWRRFRYNSWDVSNFRARSWQLLMRQSTMVRLSNASETFMKRPYFHRVWVLQELFFGKEIQLCCEHDTVNLSWLWGLCLALQKWYFCWPKYLRFLRHRAFWCPAGNVRYLLEIGTDLSPHKSDVQSMMLYVRACQCEDPRDRLFGVLSMISWYNRKPIQPDYSKDTLDLAVEILSYSDYKGLHWLLSTTTTIAQTLDLIKLPPTRLVDAIQERQSRSYMTLPAGSGLTLRKSCLKPMKFWGHRLCFQNTRWQIQPQHSKDADDWPRFRLWSPANLRGDSSAPMAQKWAAGHGWDILSADILLPQETQPEDWFLAPSFVHDNPARLDGGNRLLGSDVAFIARKDGGGRLKLVGKALVVPWEKWPTRSTWENAFRTKGVEYAVFLDPEDVIILDYSLSWPDLILVIGEEGGEALKLRADKYFETRLCGERSCSYAVPAHF